MNPTSSGLLVKLAQNPFGSDNEWTSNYVNNVVSGEAFWKLVAAGKPPECAGIIARFGKFVQPQPDGCWHWIGSRTGSWKGGQHGQFALYHGEHIYAHRFTYLIFNGPIPDGKLVRHCCDVGYCVRASHLLVGTQKDNLRDAVERDRLPKYRAPRKLTSAAVIAMRRDRMRGATIRALATAYGVSTAAVSMICALKRRTVLPPTSVHAVKRQAKAAS